MTGHLLKKLHFSNRTGGEQGAGGKQGQQLLPFSLPSTLSAHRREREGCHGGDSHGSLPQAGPLELRLPRLRSPSPIFGPTPNWRTVSAHRAEGSRGGVGAGLGQPHMPGKGSRQHPPVGHRGLRRTSSPVALSVHRADKSKDHHACASRAMPL